MTAIPENVLNPRPTEIGATHLNDVPWNYMSCSWWPQNCPEVFSYSMNGTVHYRRSDNGVWSIDHASKITPAMMASLPKAEQARIVAHAQWHKAYAASFETDDMGRRTATARAASRRLKKMDKR